MVYETEEDALRRVGKLREVGIWPGIRYTADGFELTYDPPVTRAEMTTHGYLLDPS